jgi:hypothetical protein
VRDEWDAADTEDAAAVLRRRARFHVHGFTKDGPGRDRVTWDVSEWDLEGMFASTSDAERVVGPRIV